MPVEITETALLVDGQEVPVYSGTVHYWRLERERWPAILDQVVALGFKMIETYIPWSVHEIKPGVFDWGHPESDMSSEGCHDDRKDLEGFMSLCEERGIWLIVRPGPLINAELTDFGFPEWVLLDPDAQAHTAVGSLHLDAAYNLHPPRPFPVPSYASELFYEYVGRWYDQVCPKIIRHLAPNGCVVAVQSDNETCYLFHDQTYATDYSPASLALYRSRLRDKYGDIQALNSAYRTSYSAFEQVEPPRDCEIEERADLPRHLDWAEYKEYQIIYAVSRCAKMLRDRGIDGVPVFHDVAYQQRTPLDLAKMEADPYIDWVGINCYRNKEDFTGAVRLARYLTGSVQLPFVPELGCGIWSHHPATPEPVDHEIITLGMLMHGLRAFNLYMLVERERWQGSPVTRHGALRPDRADFYVRLNTFLQRHHFWRFKRDCQVLVLRNYDLGRYAAITQTLSYAHTDLLGLPPELFTVEPDLGLRWDALAESQAEMATLANSFPGHHAPGTWMGTLLTSLSARSLDYDIADTHVDIDRLGKYSALFLNATDFMDLEDQQKILEAISAGSTVVVGPGIPYTDPTMQRPGILDRYLTAPGQAQIGRGRLIWAEQTNLPEVLSQVAPPPEYSCNDPSIALTVWRDGSQTLLFSANPTPHSRAVTLTFNGSRTLRSVWGSEQVLSGENSIDFALQPYAVQIWEANLD